MLIRVCTILYAYRYNTLCIAVQYYIHYSKILYSLNKRRTSCFLKVNLLLLYESKNYFIKYMAKYIKQELPDLHKTGEKKAYYRLKIERNIDFQHFIDCISSHNSGISKGEAMRVLMHATDVLGELLAQGCSVTIDEMGTFKATIGLQEDKEIDSFEEGTQKLNSRSLRIDGVSFQADKRLVANVDKHCELKRAGISLIHRSPFTKEERLQKALDYLNSHGAMKVKHYQELTGLSQTIAARELREFANDSSSGITSIGRFAGKVYVKRMKEE